MDAPKQNANDSDINAPGDDDNPPDQSPAEGWELPMPVAPDPTDSPTS
jgi:hypothetical protein